MSNMINLEKFADGALAEKFNIAYKEVLENIADPNTPSTDVIAEEQHFAESKSSFESRGANTFDNQQTQGFTPIHDDEEDLPF